MLAVEFSAYLYAAGVAHAEDLAGLGKLLCAGNTVVIHYSAGGKTRRIRHIGSCRGRIGREGIYGVNVVVRIVLAADGLQTVSLLKGE